jgi:uncharacterized protein YyaL (SSP411 family)
MEHESFENADIARQLNEGFVSIKVDREERPDLDHIYMSAVQSISGRGGWPMSVFLTPDLEPFFGGTYWPPTSRMGMPGFDRVLAAVSDAWVNRREETIEQAGRLAEHVRALSSLSQESGELSPALLRSAGAALERSFDHRQGGFGGAPKFPHPMDLQLLLRLWRREQRDGVLHMVTHTLDKMASGGIYDHLGGGFHRYSVDERWLVPHFEKMLYDNALLASAYLEAWQATQAESFRNVVRETLDYVLREMTHAEGGFYSTQDADSEGVEGKFYVWTPAEVKAVLGEQAAGTFCYVYDVSDQGNFEGHSILNLPKSLRQCSQLLSRPAAELEEELAASRDKLLAARQERVPPGLDDKVLVSWNGLMIEAFAQAGAALEDDRYLQAATRAADFLLSQLRDASGKLLHSWRNGQARHAACLDDYAALANALVSLYEATFDERWIDEAVSLADVVLSRFADVSGGFFYTPADHEPLIARHKDVQDSSVPSGNALAATMLVRLGKLCGRSDYLQAAEQTLRSFAGLMEQYPTATGQMLLAADLWLGPTHEIALLGDAGSADLQAVLADLRRRFLPRKLVAFRPTLAAGHRSRELDGLFAGKSTQGAQPVAYVCENFACQAPRSGRAEIVAAWAALESVDTLTPSAKND